MNTTLGVLVVALALVWASLWRQAWREHERQVRRADAARIRPARFISGMERVNDELRVETLRKRQDEAAAVAAFKRRLRTEKLRMVKAS